MRSVSAMGAPDGIAPGYPRPMQLREIMTAGVVTAGGDADLLSVAQLMRDHSVGSVVICDAEGEPAAMVTDRDLAVRALAEERSPNEPVGEHASRPLVTGEPEMDLEEAAALMVQHRVRRLPVVEGSAWSASSPSTTSRFAPATSRSPSG